MFNSRDILHVEYNVLSKNVTRHVNQSEKTLSGIFVLWDLCYVYNFISISYEFDTKYVTLIGSRTPRYCPPVLLKLTSRL
jgi:hypothetical protein